MIIRTVQSNTRLFAIFQRRELPSNPPSDSSSFRDSKPVPYRYSVDSADSSISIIYIPDPLATVVVDF